MTIAHRCPAFHTLLEPHAPLRTTPELVARQIDTVLGPMLAVADEHALHLLEFDGRRALPTELVAVARRARSAIRSGTNPILDTLADELASYFDRRLFAFRTPIALFGSPFQLRVWSRLCQVPFGSTASYAAIAGDLGCPGGQRAVARANGQNRIALLVPCHRVIGSAGELRGYGGGVWRKAQLIELEHAAARPEEHLLSLPRCVPHPHA